MEIPEATRSPLKRLWSFFAFEPGEARPTLLLTLYLLFAIASVIALKAASNALFLTRFSARELPLVYVAIAVTAGLVVSLYLRLSARLPQHLLLIYTQLFAASHLLAFWWLLGLHLDWLPALVYIWTGIYAVIIPSQVWMLANHLFTTRQARRLFAIVGSGGILGAALGGLGSRELAQAAGTTSLLPACIVILLACSVITGYLWRRSGLPGVPSPRSRPAGGPASLFESFLAVRSSRYLMLMAILVVLSAILNNLVDYQFKYIVRRDISDRDQMTAFFAGFSSYMAFFSFLMQLVLTSRIMRWFGLNLAIFVLPVSMLAGSTVLLFSAALTAAVLLKGADSAFRHSIDRSSVELLWVPLPARLKQQAKSFIDVVASRWADGLGGGLLILLATVLHWSVQQISWVNLVIGGAWLAVAWKLRREYVQTLRNSIERRDISAEALLVEMAGASPREITTVLTSPDERAVETGLGILQYGRVNVAAAHLGALLTHMSPTIRRKALAIVAGKGVSGCAPQVQKFLYLDDHVDSLWQALDYLERFDGANFRNLLADLLESPYLVLRATAAARLLGLAEGRARARAEEVFTAFVEMARHSTAVQDRRRAAELLGRVSVPLACQCALAEFLNDPDPEVVRAAAVSAGQARQPDLLPRLIELAGDRRWRTEARRALTAFGPAILADLYRAMLEPHRPPANRRALPRVLGSIGGPEAAGYLVAALDAGDAVVQYQALRALSRMRLRQTGLQFDASRLTGLILRELRKYYEYVSLLQGVPQNGVRSGTLFLRRGLGEHLNRKLDVIFRLIGLLYPPKEIFDAYYGLRSGRVDLRANALEFLDNTLPSPVRQMLLPILEDHAAERILEHGRSFFGIRSGGYADSLRRLLADADPWLQACAAYAAGEEGLQEVGAAFASLDGVSDALLRETVLAARERMSRGPAAGRTAWEPAPAARPSQLLWRL
jgi:AAA family ATP:ADP antiporter